MPKLVNKFSISQQRKSVINHKIDNLIIFFKGIIPSLKPLTHFMIN